MAGCATLTGSAGHDHASTPTNPEMASCPDHSALADQCMITMGVMLLAFAADVLVIPPGTMNLQTIDKDTRV